MREDTGNSQARQRTDGARSKATLPSKAFHEDADAAFVFLSPELKNVSRETFAPGSKEITPVSQNAP
jgi:hypothetical protein